MNDAYLIERGARAKAVLNSEIYQESWESCRQAILLLIEKTPLSETVTAEDLRRCLKLLRDARSFLELCMKQGRYAEIRLVEAESKPERKVHLFRP